MKKVALITGGTRGIGYGIAEKLAEEGFNLVLNGMRESALVHKVIEDLRKKNVEVHYIRGNVSLAEDRENMIMAIRERYGTLNILVNNAGMAPRNRSDILESSPESFEEVLKVNLEGPYFLSQLAANWMIEQKSGDGSFKGMIINISSISATVASVNRGEYCVSKAGMSMMTQLFAVRLGEFNIPVYEIRPGIIKTDMTAGVRDKYDQLISEGLCVQPRWGLSEDVGLAVASLARGDLPYSTGQVIMVEGGMTLPRL